MRGGAALFMRGIKASEHKKRCPPHLNWPNKRLYRCVRYHEDTVRNIAWYSYHHPDIAWSTCGWGFQWIPFHKIGGNFSGKMSFRCGVVVYIFSCLLYIYFILKMFTLIQNFQTIFILTLRHSLSNWQQNYEKWTWEYFDIFRCNIRLKSLKIILYHFRMYFMFFHLFL